MNDTKLDAANPMVARLMELQGSEPDKKFAQRWLGFSDSSWNRIKRGAYAAADPTPMLAKMEGALRQLEEHFASGGSKGTEILKLSLIKQGLAAVKRSFSEPRDRLVVVLAPTGGGKSTLARAIEDAYHGRTLTPEATETWRQSYLAACHGILGAAGVKELPGSKRQAEAKLLEELGNRPRTVIIDEAHYFGRDTINLIKAILNRTACSVVLLAIPALWERMKRQAWEEAAQLRSRTCALIALERVTDGDVDDFFKLRLNGSWSGFPAKDKARAIHLARESANQFGLMDTVARIAKEIQEDASGGGSVGLGHVEAAVRTVKALRR